MGNGMENRNLQALEINSENLLEVNENRKYVASPDYILRQITGENVLVCCGENPRLGNGMLTLNDSYVFLWKLYQEPKTFAQVLACAQEVYEAPEGVLERDIRDFLFQSVQFGLLVEA